jgi:hypothetical protein
MLIIISMWILNEQIDDKIVKFGINTKQLKDFNNKRFYKRNETFRKRILDAKFFCIFYLIFFRWL